MRRNYLIVSVLLFCFLIAGCGNNDGVIATVNGKEISKADYDQRYNVLKFSYEAEQGTTIDDKKDTEIVKNIRDLAYDNLVKKKLLDPEAAKQGVKVTDKEIDENINYIKKNKNKTDKNGFESFLKQLDIDEKELRGILKDELIYNKMEEKVSAGVVISDQEVKDYYDKNQKTFEKPAGIQIYHILLTDKATAMEVLKKLKAGEDWDKLASEYSIDESNKAQGGDLGVVNKSTNFVEEFKTAALKLKPGEITEVPVQTTYGYHIIKAGENKPASIATYGEVKDSIQAQLEKEKKTEVFNQYIEGLKKKADIKDLRDK